MSEINIFNDTFFAMGTRCDVVLPDLETEFAEQTRGEINTTLQESSIRWMEAELFLRSLKRLRRHF